MPTFSNTPRPAYVYEAATDQWIPVGFGPHTHAVTDVTNAFNTTTVTTKGDLVVAAGSNNITRLAAGANGQILVADSTTTTGLRYQDSVTSGKNFVINGSFDIWQRGTTVSGGAGGAYTADRWFLYAGSNGSVSRQATGDSTNLPNIQYCGRVGRPVSTTDATTLYFTQSFETTNSIPLAGKTVTFSFYARRGANYSSASSVLTANVFAGTGTDQNVRSAGYTGLTTPISSVVTLTTTWQRFTVSGTIASNVTEVSVDFLYTPVGTAGAADFFEVTGVQLEVGSVATAFSRAGGDIQGELAKCQRYYFVSSGGQVATAIASTDVYLSIPNVMRAAPTVLTPLTAVILDRYGVANYTQSTRAVVSSGVYVSANAAAVIYTNFSGLTAGLPYVVRSDGGSVILSSEL
jgi:hypothetical protein